MVTFLAVTLRRSTCNGFYWGLLYLLRAAVYPSEFRGLPLAPELRSGPHIDSEKRQI